MCYRTMRWLCAISLLIASPARAADVLTLDAALEKAEEANPAVKAARATVKAAEGGRLQADLPPNPQLDFMTENVAGSGAFTGVDAAETTLGLSQRIELGGKRRSRVALAEREREGREIDATVALADLQRETRRAYMDAAAAEQQHALAEAIVAREDMLRREIQRRVDAARDPLVQLRKAETAVAEAEAAETLAAREVEHTKHVLSSLWGGHESDFTLDAALFSRVQEPPNEEEVEERLEQSPITRQLQAATATRKAQLAVEQANAVADPSLSASVRDLRATDDQALVFGASYPLQFFDRNQGGIARAKSNIAASRFIAESEGLKLRNALFDARERAANAVTIVTSLEDRVLPAARDAYRLAQRGFRLGRFSYLDVQDAKETLNDAERRRVTTLMEYHQATADMERLMGPKKQETDHGIDTD